MRYPNDYPNRWNLQHEILKIFNDALEISSPFERPVILSLDKKEFGDYYCNNVLSIWYKKKPETMPLKHIAEAIKNNIPSNDMMEDCRIQSGGFLTFKLSRIWIAKSIHKMLRDGIDTWAPILYMERAIIDFSFRKIYEEMDVDHFRSTIIGDTLLRMLEFGEVDVILKNQIGNRHSTRYGMLIQYLMESSQNGQTNGEFEESKKRFDEDDEFREKAHQALTCLQAKICEMERKMYQKVYMCLGVRMEQRVKRFYSPYIHETLDILRQEGLTEKSEGDEVIFVEEKLQHESIERKKKPLTIVKKTGDYDNALTYLTSLRHQLKEEKPELIINVADVGKKKDIEMCIAAARRARWLPTDEKRYPLTKFVGYSLVQDDDLNRAGKLADLLENAKTRCKAALVERVKADEWTAKELEDTASALGYGAVKYAQLKDFRVFKYIFDIDEMLNDKGNTGVYLLYKHAQLSTNLTRELLLEKDEERELGLHLIQFTEMLEFACTRFLPDHVCKYLYELSEKFNCFYSIVCQAVGDVDEEANKLLVCEATRVVMTKCFHLLGITPIDKISICISEKMTMPPPVKGDDEDVIESFSNNEDKEETVSSSSSGEDKEDIVSSSSGDEKTPAKRFKSSDLSLEEEEEKEPLKYLTPRFQLFSALVVVDNFVRKRWVGSNRRT